jgi:TRAP-type C4-dicarboxylate transport system permease small subunit
MKGLDRYISFLNTLGGIFIVLMMLLITVDIILRTTINAPILGNIELVQAFAIIIVYFGFSYNALKDEHVKVDVIKRWPAMDIVTDIISVAVVTLFVYATFVNAQGSLMMHQQTQMLHIPLAPLKFFIAFGFLNLDLGIIGLRINLIRKRRLERQSDKTSVDTAKM